MARPLDLAVVGGGIVGTMAAFLALRAHPSWKIALFERSLVGQGATGASGGHEHPFGTGDAQKRLATRSGALFRELEREIPGLPVYDRPLYGIVAKSRASEILQGFTRDGAHIATEAESEVLRRSFPDLRLSGEQTLLAGCPGRSGHPAGVAAMLAKRLRLGGADVCEGVEIGDVGMEGPHLALRSADGRTFRAHRVLAAPGPWILRGPGAAAARANGVRIKKVAALHVHRVPTRDDPILYLHDDDAYLLPLHERGHWVFSFTSLQWDVHPEASALRIDTEDRAVALSLLQRYCPSQVELCRGGRVFCDAYSPDRTPLVLEVEPGLVVAGAASGFGYRLAPAIAEDALRALDA